MKKIFLIALIATLALSNNVQAQSKRAARVKYVLENMDIDGAQQKKLKPLLEKYLEEKKIQTAPYEDMKDDLKPKIEAGSLSDKQADKLLKLKWEADQKELNLKKQYEVKFRTVLSASKTYRCFDLLNDKKSKYLGTKE